MPLAGRLADRFGARNLLVAGPATTGLSMLLLANIGLSGGPVDYWTTFFPLVLLFGLGMGLTVAPLTTAVMGAVPAHLAGAALGINNSVSRLAGVMMVAILGSAFLFVFSASLTDRAAAIDLITEVRQQVLDQAPRLGEAEVPADVPAAAAGEVERAYRLAFIDSFDLLLRISAGMAWAAALVALVTVEKQRPAAATG